MSGAPQYIEFFGSDILKRLHGCANAEIDRGPESPCRDLARSDRRPQVGFGNPRAPIVFLSPSPLDAASASGEAFAEWVDREAALEHHMRSETVQPYFRFVQAALAGLRQRWGQPAGRRDALDLAFHTWSVRCATSNPDRVTEGPLAQCMGRHMESMLEAIAPRVIVAMGGPIAQHFWWRVRGTWKGWGPLEGLHGTALDYPIRVHPVPVILSVHPNQQRVEHRPEVIAQRLSEHLQPADLAPPSLKAA